MEETILGALKPIIIVAIVFSVPITAIVFCFVLRLKKTQGGGSIRQREQLNADETKLIQEIHQGLSRMEERVEALETILVDLERNKKREEGEK